LGCQKQNLRVLITKIHGFLGGCQIIIGVIGVGGVGGVIGGGVAIVFCSFSSQ